MSNTSTKISGLFLLCLVLVYVVILAGGTVRATGAGMGCPDWPLCFGKLIPPMSEADLPENWRSYIHGSGAEDPTFDPVHTWTEYLNRLAGATLGLFTLILSFSCWASKKVSNKTLLFSLGALASVIFNGWLGSQVVASDLKPLLVSLHMMGAFLVQMFLVLGFINSRKFSVLPTVTKSYYRMGNICICICMLFLLIQIGMGIQIRESVDWIFKLDHLIERDGLIEIIPWIFYVHRSFSWLLLFFAGLTVYFTVKSKMSFDDSIGEMATWKFLLSDPKIRWSSFYVILVLAQMLIGGALNHFGFPMFMQPLHLLTANLMFGSLCFLFFCEAGPILNEKKRLVQTREIFT